MGIEEYTKRELLKLKERDWQQKSIYDSIVIVPTRTKHDSGFTLMAIIGIRNGKPIEIAAHCDDVNWYIPSGVYPGEMILRTDCYYPHNIIHFWSNKCIFEVGASASSTDVRLKRKP